MEVIYYRSNLLWKLIIMEINKGKIINFYNKLNKGGLYEFLACFSN